MEKWTRRSSPSLYFSLVFFSSLLQRCSSGLNYLLDFPCISQTSGSLAGLREYQDIKPQYQIFCVLAKNSLWKQKAGGTCSLMFICVLLLFRNLLEFKDLTFFLTATYCSIYLDFSKCRATRLIHFFNLVLRNFVACFLLERGEEGKKRRVLELQTTILFLFLFK